MQTLKTFEAALKDNYLPVWRNQLAVEPSPLLGKITNKPLISDKIVSSAPVGLSGGFGFGAEGEPTPHSGAVPFTRFETRAKDMYVDVRISAKAVSLTGSGGAMANALDTEVKGAYETAKWNIGRSLFGNGTGVLAHITATSGSSNTITVDDVAYVKEGLIIDVYTDAEALQTGEQGVRILSVDRVNKKIVVDKAMSYAAGFITVQNSYKRELTGLNAIFDPTITSLYGVNKAENAFINPVVIDAGKTLEDAVITRALREAKNIKNSNIDMLLCGDAAYDEYVDYLRVNNIRVEDMSHTIQGGFKAIKFVFGNKEVDIVNESFVPSAEMWGVDTECLELHSKDWNFLQLQNGGIFNLMEGRSEYRALLANYGDLLCTNPGGCVRIYNCV